MFEFHENRKWYFDIQVMNTEKYVIPFIERTFKILPGMRVLEIGSGEGGVLKAFINKGCIGVGVEQDMPKIENASKFLADDIRENKVHIIEKDIYLVNIETEFKGHFDIIILKDVIEHIHDQSKLIGQMKKYLKPEGVVFFGFPPWYMPYGGHQQICTSWLSKMPYIHLLPRPIYRGLLKWKKEDIPSLMEIRDTGISIERFEKICKKNEYKIKDATHYLINPIYEWKFKLKPVTQGKIIKALPFIRNFLTTCVYYLITPKNN